MGFGFRRVRCWWGAWKPQYTPKQKARTAVLLKAAGWRRFRFKHQLVSLDSAVIDLHATLFFDWARFRRMKRVVKASSRWANVHAPVACPPAARK